MEKEKRFFQKNGFTISTLEDVDFWARKEGKNNLFLKFVDFYFLKKIPDPNVADIKEFHSDSLKTANKEFKLPKALRLTVPNINSVLITDTIPSQEIIEFVSHRNKSIIGGQQETVFIIDSSTNRCYSPGIEITKITGEAKILWGNQKEFNKLNGHNRAHYFINMMLQELHQFN